MTKDKLAKSEPFAIKALEMGVDTLADLIKQNIGDEGLDQFDLSRAVNPQGENVEWKIESLDEEPEKLREVEGIIVFHRKVRTYYQTEYKKGGGPPTCTSTDGKNGVGNPGGDCELCPFSKFGSGKNEGKACKETKQLYIIRSGELFPTLFNVTSVNIRKPNKYLIDLLSKRSLAFNEVITKIRLEPDTSSGGYDYARTDFSLSRVLTDEEKAAAKALTGIFGKNLSTLPVLDDDAPTQETVAPQEQTFAPDNPEEIPY